MIKLFNLKKSLIIYIWLPSKCAAFRACAYLEHKAVIYFYSVKHFNLFKTYLQVVFFIDNVYDKSTYGNFVFEYL